jgi:hypothetical protein
MSKPIIAVKLAPVTRFYVDIINAVTEEMRKANHEGDISAQIENKTQAEIHESAELFFVNTDGHVFDPRALFAVIDLDVPEKQEGKHHVRISFFGTGQDTKYCSNDLEIDEFPKLVPIIARLAYAFVGCGCQPSAVNVNAEVAKALGKDFKIDDLFFTTT